MEEEIEQYSMGAGETVPAIPPMEMQTYPAGITREEITPVLRALERAISLAGWRDALSPAAAFMFVDIVAQETLRLLAPDIPVVADVTPEGRLEEFTSEWYYEEFLTAARDWARLRRRTRMRNQGPEILPNEPRLELYPLDAPRAWRPSLTPTPEPHPLIGQPVQDPLIGQPVQDPPVGVPAPDPAPLTPRLDPERQAALDEALRRWAHEHERQDVLDCMDAQLASAIGDIEDEIRSAEAPVTMSQEIPRDHQTIEIARYFYSTTSGRWIGIDASEAQTSEEDL